MANSYEKVRDIFSLIKEGAEFMNDGNEGFAITYDLTQEGLENLLICLLSPELQISLEKAILSESLGITPQNSKSNVLKI